MTVVENEIDKEWIISDKFKANFFFFFFCPFRSSVYYVVFLFVYAGSEFGENGSR